MLFVSWQLICHGIARRRNESFLPDRFVSPHESTPSSTSTGKPCCLTELPKEHEETHPQSFQQLIFEETMYVHTDRNTSPQLLMLLSAGQKSKAFLLSLWTITRQPILLSSIALFYFFIRPSLKSLCDISTHGSFTSFAVRSSDFISRH